MPRQATRLPKVEGDKPARKRFKAYPLGYFRQPYVLAVRSNYAVRFLDGWTSVQTDPAATADEDWYSLSAGEGAKGSRLYH